MLVTVLWSSSYVLIKWGLADMPPLFFATVRYALAFSILLAIDLMTTHRGSGRGSGALGRREGILLVVAGLGGYTVAQGLQFVGLYYLPAVTTSFLLNFNPFFVLLLGVGLLGEGATLPQFGGLALALVGAWAFFSQQAALGGQTLGVLIVVVSGLGWAFYTVVVRMLQKSGSVGSLRLTTTTMGVGVIGMVVLTAITGQYAQLTSNGILIIVFLATANTALAFFLWNWSLKAIPAYELTVLQDLMLAEIAIFAFVFLQEAITPLMIGGMALVLVGVLIVQMKAARGKQGVPRIRF
jgi:drug/metabolite transporter (DMT)-like permease